MLQPGDFVGVELLGLEFVDATAAEARTAARTVDWIDLRNLTNVSLKATQAFGQKHHFHSDTSDIRHLQLESQPSFSHLT